jgi:hypothetical protein
VTGPGVVAHAYNPSYLEGGVWEDHGSRPWGKKFEGPHFNQQLGVVTHAYHPRNSGSINKSISVQSGLGKISRLPLKNNSSKQKKKKKPSKVVHTLL